MNHEHGPEYQGIFSCAECVSLAVFGKTLKECAAENARLLWEDFHKDKNCQHPVKYPDLCGECFNP